jgi:putative endonuclease
LDNRKSLGDNGEQVAASFLRANGYKIIAQKWHGTRYEIDIIAQKRKGLFFIEVKTARQSNLGPPQVRVDPIKQKRIGECALEFLAQCDLNPEDIRFDVIAIIWNKDKPPLINHIEGAFVMDY